MSYYEPEPYSNYGIKCPWAMCDVSTSDHTYCAKVFAGRVNEKKAHPKGRCISCGCGEAYWKHKLEYMDREGAHTFIGEFELIDPVADYDEFLTGWEDWVQKHPIDMGDDGSRVYNWRAIKMESGNWIIEVGY